MVPEAGRKLIATKGGRKREVDKDSGGGGGGGSLPELHEGVVYPQAWERKTQHTTESKLINTATLLIPT